MVSVNVFIPCEIPTNAWSNLHWPCISECRFLSRSLSPCFSLLLGSCISTIVYGWDLDQCTQIFIYSNIHRCYFLPVFYSIPNSSGMIACVVCCWKYVLNFHTCSAHSSSRPFPNSDHGAILLRLFSRLFFVSCHNIIARWHIINPSICQYFDSFSYTHGIYTAIGARVCVCESVRDAQNLVFILQFLFSSVAHVYMQWLCGLCDVLELERHLPRYNLRAIAYKISLWKYAIHYLWLFSPSLPLLVGERAWLVAFLGWVYGFDRLLYIVRALSQLLDRMELVPIVRMESFQRDWLPNYVGQSAHTFRHPKRSNPIPHLVLW